MKIVLENITAKIGEKTILRNLSAEFDFDKTTALMGKNGSGKTTLSNIIMGNPKYIISEGKIKIKDKNSETDITSLNSYQRSKLGIFLSFQSPVEIEGLTLKSMLRASYTSLKGKIQLSEFNKLLNKKADLIGFDKKLFDRSLNFGFSGGEKKKTEMLQLLLLEPKFAILDEIDSGLDIDSIKTIAETIKLMKEKTGFLIISHYKRILKFVKPDKVIILISGEIAKTGTSDLIDKIENHGYGWVSESKNDK